MDFWYIAKKRGIENAYLDCESGKPMVGSYWFALHFADYLNRSEQTNDYSVYNLTSYDFLIAKKKFSGVYA